MSSIVDESLPPPIPERAPRRIKPEEMEAPPLPIGKRKVIRLDTVGRSRAHNDYVDTPNLPTVHRLRPNKRSQNELLISKNNNINENRERQRRQLESKCAIVEQPITVNQLPIEINKPERDSIICRHCGKCKCRQCTERRELPPMRLCCQKEQCTAIDVIEKVSCLCCVKGLAYHCCYDENSQAFEDPCVCCATPKCMLRWACMGLVSLCVPCLCCYWPLRGAAECVRSCYNCCCVPKGCRCKDRPDTTKFILASDYSSTSSSSI